MLSDKKVLSFINKRFSYDDHWANGNCYYFAIILRARFPEVNIYYDAVAGHFIVGALSTDRTNNLSIHYFDWNGRYYSDTKPILFAEIQREDEQWYRRLVRDCIY